MGFVTASDGTEIFEGAALKVCPGAPHGITDTHKERLNADPLAFVQGVVRGSTVPVLAETAGSRS